MILPRPKGARYFTRAHFDQPANEVIIVWDFAGNGSVSGAIVS